MKDTAVKTEDYQGNLRTVTGKLYLPDAAGRNSLSDNIIYVGKNNDIGIALSVLNAITQYMNFFWLRSPNNNSSTELLVAKKDVISAKNIMFGLVVPAFDLDLSSVVFASVAPAASSNGTLNPATAMTLRHDAGTTLGSAKINTVGTSVAVTDAPSGTYLVVQNSDGAWAKAVTGTETIPSTDFNNLITLDNCEVWLEKTNPNARITTATMAVEQTGYNVTVTAGSNMTKTTTSGGVNQTRLSGAMTSVVFKANDGYYFPTDYSVASVNGISVTRDSYTQITVSGTPTANVTITLTGTTEKTTQSAPIGLSDGVDKIAGTTTAMEYASASDATTWNAYADTNTTVVAGTWYVRYQETDTAKASPATQVIVTESGNPPTYHSITTVVSPTNGGSVSGAGQVSDGGSTTLKATANSGYQFQKWSKDGNTVGTSSTLKLTNIVEDAEYTAFFKKNNNSNSEEESKNESETTPKEVTTPQTPSALPYKTTQGTFKGEKSAFNIKALEPTTTSTRNQSTLANHFTAQYFKRRTGTVIACYDMYAPWGAKKEWKDGTCKFAWNIDNIKAGDTVFVIWYNENNPLGAQYIKANVSENDLVTFTIPYLGDVSTISIVKVEK